MEKISINKNFILGKNKFAIRNFSFAIIFIFVALFGLFGMAGKANAAPEQTDPPKGDCITEHPDTKELTTWKNKTEEQCKPIGGSGGLSFGNQKIIRWNKYVEEGETDDKGTCRTQNTISNLLEISRATQDDCKKDPNYISWDKATQAETDAEKAANDAKNGKTPEPKGTKSDFEKMLKGKGCDSLWSFDMGACVLKFLYYGIQMPVAGILWIAAKFFDYLIFFTLSTTLFKQPFVGGAWGVVRDLSNIFFILILLFVAFETILGLAHDAQKTITKVIVVAMLINFSMFFTGVVIDTSNVLALVFYNKVDIKYKDKDGNIKDRPDTPVGNAKDISGSMAEKFNLTNLVTGDMFKQAGDTVNKVPGSGQTIGSEGVPTSLMITIVLIAIVIMAVAAYAFIVAGLSFLGRMIELFVLIIFSPFAFMSSTVPKLAGTEYLGWEPWSKRLITVSFMAPIFMFFLYFIFLLMKGPLLEQAKNVSGDSFISMILGMILPTLFIVSLLLKATEFAKKGSGKFGEVVMTGAKMVGGLALGAATGGAALVASNTLGRVARNAANNEEVKARAAAGDKGAQRRLALANSFAKSSFDLRQTGLGKFAAKQTGMDFNKGFGVVGLSTDQLKGGRRERDKEVAKKFDETRKTYMMSDAHARKQDERAKKYKDEYETDLQLAMNKKKIISGDFKNNGEKDKFIKEFKRRYENGESLKGYQIDKERAEKIIRTSKEVNEERQKAYALSLENPRKKIEDGEIIRKSMGEIFRSSFKAGLVNSVTTPGGLATTAAIGAATGGVGLVLSPAIFALSAAIKDVAIASRINTQEEKGKKSIFAEHEDVVAAVRKGIKPSIEEALHHLNEAAGVKHEEHHEEHPAPATAAAPATPEHNTSSDHSAAGHPTH